MADPFGQVEQPEFQLTATLAALEAKASRAITRLFSSTLDDGPSFNRQLSTIKEDMAALRSATRELQILAEEQETDEEAQRLATVLKQHHSEYERLQTAFKHANIQARRNTEAAAAAARRALLAGDAASKAPVCAAREQSAVAASKGITESLQRTRQLMAQELEHTSATLAAMDTSNERLAVGKEELQSQRGLFGSSRRLLRKLHLSTILDNISLYGGLALFFLVAAYILQKRTLYFVPVQRVLAPVGRSAWGHTRAAFGTAQDLAYRSPAALTALQKRLMGQGGGGGGPSSLPFDSRPPSVVAPDVSTGDDSDDGGGGGIDGKDSRSGMSSGTAADLVSSGIDNELPLVGLVADSEQDAAVAGEPSQLREQQPLDDGRLKQPAAGSGHEPADSETHRGSEAEVPANATGEAAGQPSDLPETGSAAADGLQPDAAGPAAEPHEPATEEPHTTAKSENATASAASDVPSKGGPPPTADSEPGSSHPDSVPSESGTTENATGAAGAGAEGTAAVGVAEPPVAVAMTDAAAAAGEQDLTPEPAAEPSDEGIGAEDVPVVPPAAKEAAAIAAAANGSDAAAEGHAPESDDTAMEEPAAAEPSEPNPAPETAGRAAKGVDAASVSDDAPNAVAAGEAASQISDEAAAAAAAPEAALSAGSPKGEAAASGSAEPAPKSATEALDKQPQQGQQQDADEAAAADSAADPLLGAEPALDTDVLLRGVPLVEGGTDLLLPTAAKLQGLLPDVVSDQLLGGPLPDADALSGSQLHAGQPTGSAEAGSDGQSSDGSAQQAGRMEPLEHEVGIAGEQEPAVVIPDGVTGKTAADEAAGSGRQPVDPLLGGGDSPAGTAVVKDVPAVDVSDRDAVAGRVPGNGEAEQPVMVADPANPGYEWRWSVVLNKWQLFETGSDILIQTEGEPGDEGGSVLPEVAAGDIPAPEAAAAADDKQPDAAAAYDEL